MKCIVLAGGRGERLWPLSRKNYPKQFIQIQKNHSIFQETIARNMPYCDEFIIVTSYEYRYIVENQMNVFQGVTYRCIYEEEPKGTASAILLACFELQPSEYIYVVASDNIIDISEYSEMGFLNYQDSVVLAKKIASEGKIALFGIPCKVPDTRYGWIQYENDDVIKFIAKPTDNDRSVSKKYMQNAGMLLFENGIMQELVKNIDFEYYNSCLKIFAGKKIDKNGILYSYDNLESIRKEYIEELVLEKTSLLDMVKSGFEWTDVGRIEDLSSAKYGGEGVSILHNTKDTFVINECNNKAVVVNNVDDVFVVNTNDAVYVGKYGKSSELKNIITKSQLLVPYVENGTISYRPWGYYEYISGNSVYRIRKVVLYPGKTIYAHSHKNRNENITVISGKISITIDNIQKNFGFSRSIDISKGTVHQISNTGTEEAIFIETACGQSIYESDIIGKATDDIDESELGIKNEPFIKLFPAFKDYLWGGTKLRDVYNKKCDYDIIAESWELSAHPAGQSIVASGRHKGMLFGDYIKTVGKEVLGWKCQSMTQFPLLIKFIDAKGNLSVQVHPDDDYALEYEHEYGKNEMWYILDCEPGASLYIGFNRKVSRKEVEQRVKNNTILEVLNKVETKKGDVYFIPAGTVHAIGAGNMICEIQQNSNCTYRLYDYDRRDKYGNPRELHLQKALAVLNYDKYEKQNFEEHEVIGGNILSRCKYFETTVYDIQDEFVLNVDDSRFISILCLEGSAEITMNGISEKIAKGESIFVSASNNKVILNGKVKIIVSHI